MSEAARPRVTFVITPLAPVGGMQTALLRLATRLVQTHQVRVLALHDGDASFAPGVRVSTVHGRTTATRLLALRRHLLTLDEDEVVVLTGLWVARQVLLAAPSVLGRAIAWEHSLTRARIRSGPRFRLKAELAARAYRRCARVVTVSEAVADALSQQWGIDSDVVPNLASLDPVSPGLLRSIPRAQDEPPGAPQDDGRPARFIAVGAITPVKNYELLLRALVRVRHPWTLELVGEGPLREHLEQLSADLGIDDRVEWTGQVDDVPRRMARSDLLVHPSASETFGYVLLEAAEQWLPVVVVDAPVMDRLVPSLVPGLRCAPEEASMARQIEAALARGGRWDFEGADSLRRRHFADDRILAAWAELLERSMAGRSGRSDG